MSWTPKPLSEILEQSGRHRAGDQDLPVLSITMKHGLVDQADKFKKRIASLSTSNYRIAYKNELVVGFPIDEGVLGFQTKYPAGIVSPAYDIWKLTSEADCHIPYLERYLRSSQARSLYASRMQGAVARRRSLTKADFLNLEIPFPPPDDQIRIAHLLGKVEGLIAQRKKHLQQLDDLLKSVFLEMFGDPVRNEKGWDKKVFSDLLTEIESGSSPKCEARTVAEGEWGVLKLGAITSCFYRENENKALPPDVEPQPRHEVKSRDLLFSRKNTYELVAASAYVFKTQPKILMPDLIFRFVFKENAEINPIYIWKLLISDSQRRKIQSLAAGAAGSMPNISKTNLRQVLLPIPPLGLQNQFAAIVETVEGIKSQYQQSLTELENLYGALSQKAFKGELDLSRVPLPPTQQNTDRDNGHSVEQQASPYVPTITGTKPIELPLPHDIQSWSSAAGRRAVIGMWLDSYIKQLDGGALFSSDDFLAATTQRLGDLMEDENPLIDQVAYNQIKLGIFHALGSDRLIQEYDDAANCVRLRVAKG